jgi:3D-(3,5/4)-trihydroxycyclohexane-1,2-dione acylhydrolase (decyclizing)
MSSQSVRRTTAQAVVSYLSVQHGKRDGRIERLIPAVFGIFGHGNVAGLGQALEEYGDDLPYLQARNEQSMVHAAVGFAKASRRRRLLACSSSIGPGATNMVTGAALATINRLPVLLLPADTYATRRQGPVLQQLEAPFAGDVSVNDCFRPVVRFFDRITRPEQLLTALPEAMRVLTDPRETGAVALSLPQDVQSEAYDFPAGFLAEHVWSIGRAEPAPREVAAVAQLLAAAERPLLIAGGGVLYSEAEGALAAFADRLGIPVAETFGGKGAVQEPAWWNLGGLGLEGNPACNELAEQADLVLAVGTRLTDFATGSQSLFQSEDVRFASINVDARDAFKQGASAVVGDARLALERLGAAAVSAGAVPNQSWRRLAEERRAVWRQTLAAELAPSDASVLSQGQLIATMQAAATSGDTVIAAAGGPPGDLLKIWDATGGRHCHLEFGFSCMGYELPAAIGVRMAQPEGEVIVLIGDGTFLMNPTELVTALQEGLKITIVVSENHGFQVIHRLQRLRAGRSFGNEFRVRDGQDGRLEGQYLSLDFAKIAEGLGATALTATTAEQVLEALDAARRSETSTVIVVETAPQADLPAAGVWWDVAPAEVSEDPVVQELRAAYVADRARLQRWFG